MLLTTFIYGLLAASLALIVEVATLDFSTGSHFTRLITLILAVLIEESCRLLLLNQYTKRFFTEVPPLKNILFIGLFFGLGFTAPELLMILGEYNHNTHLLLPILGIPAVHITLSLLYILTLGKKLGLNLWSAIMVGFILHLSYNAFLVN